MGLVGFHANQDMAVPSVLCSVTFKFPLPPRSAVYKLEARIGDRTITSQVGES
jgi:hypothetical protein